MKWPYNLRQCYGIFSIIKSCPLTYSNYSTSVFTIDAFTSELLQKKQKKWTIVRDDFANCKSPDITDATFDSLNKKFKDLILKNKHNDVEQLIMECIYTRKLISKRILFNLFDTYSEIGRVDMVVLIQQYAKTIIDFYLKNGQFMHYLAKAQCMKGNSDKGLSILKDAYEKYYDLRSIYREFFSELIKDSVMNRSEASLMIFKKYVFQFSNIWNDHYPLVCFWLICWRSTWFSDQMLSNELFDESEPLRSIVGEKGSLFSIRILRTEFNDDAVIRLLQALLRYKMMTEYSKVLQVLFDYRLRNRDIRGCTEIIRNCEALGMTLPGHQHSRYLCVLIGGKTTYEQPSKPETLENFKLKF